MSLIYAKYTSLAISSDSNAKDSLYLSQVLDLEYLPKLVLELLYLLKSFSRNAYVINVDK